MAPATAEEHSQDFKIREAVPGDQHFFWGTWKQGHWKGSPWAARLRWQTYSRGHDPIVRRLLAASNVLVACDPSDANEIMGYIVWEPKAPGGPCLHWCYVKPAFRMAGVARALLAATGLPPDLSGVRVTHPTRDWFSSPALVRDGREVRSARHGLEERFRAEHDPYPWMNRSNP